MSHDPVYDIVDRHARRARRAVPDGWVTVESNRGRTVLAEAERAGARRAAITIVAVGLRPPPDGRVVAARIARDAAVHGTVEVRHRSVGTFAGRATAIQVIDVAGARQISAVFVDAGGRTVVAIATCDPAAEERVGRALLAVVEDHP